MSALLHLLMPLLNLFVQAGSEDNYITNRNAEAFGGGFLFMNHSKWFNVNHLTTKLPDGWLDELLMPPLLSLKNCANKSVGFSIYLNIVLFTCYWSSAAALLALPYSVTIIHGQTDQLL